MRTISGSLAAVVVCLARPAAADRDPSHGRLVVTWDAPPTCPDVASVRSAVASMLEGTTAGSGDSQLTARGAVTETEGRFQLRIQLDSKGASETKTMEASACQTLADALALVVAFTFDPSVGRRPPQAVAAGTAGGSAPVAGPPEPGRDGASDRPPTQLLAGPLGALGAGALPFPAYGVGARVAVEGGPRWELAGMFWPEQPASADAVASHAVGADVWLATVQPSACVSFARGAVAPCVGGELGAMKATGTGVRVVDSGTSWWLALTAGVSLRAPLARRVDLRFRLDAGVPVFRPSFLLENVGTAASVQAFRPAPVVGVLSVEPEFELFSTDRGESRHDSH